MARLGIGHESGNGVVPLPISAHGSMLIGVVAAMLLCVVATGGTAVAAPTSPADPVAVAAATAASADGSWIESVDRTGVNDRRLWVHSTAMDRSVQVEVRLATDRSRPRPTLYLLNGSSGGQDDIRDGDAPDSKPVSWSGQTEVLQFLGDKDVNVVQVIGGHSSYYTDWIRSDPALGRNMWQTFLTKELPPLIDSTLATTRVNAIAGVSMSGTSVLALAISAPHLYRSVAAYSGCAQTSDPAGQAFARITVAEGGGNADNMWGPVGDPRWHDNDPYLNADRLRGIHLFLSSGNGLAGLHGPDPLTYVAHLDSGIIEAAANLCTHNLQRRLTDLDIPATFAFHAGMHQWLNFQDDLHASWPVLSAGLEEQ